MKIKKGDTVEVISGNDRGVRGTVNAALPKENRVVVAGVHIIKKHQRRTGDVRTQFGIIEREAPIHVSNVALVCPHCDRPTRVGYDVAADGTKARMCRKCKEIID
ncbi:MAG TPA: 50S ribosomal protein L24 [Chloroflexi bacterium]|jgi:large subunit ribosomal protein L24|nr:50S ribosomal protein L24 [Chloroflexota bacterium]